MESIDSLAKAVNEYKGGMVLVSHDMRLISQVAKEIWICDNKKITKYKGDILNFKMDMRDQMGIAGQQQGNLRGDASVMKKDAGEPKKKKKVASSKTTVSVVDNSKAPESAPSKTPTTKPLALTSEASSDPLVVDNDDVVWDTDDEKDCAPAESSSGKEHEAQAAPAPPNGRYIPPHLRNR